MRKPIARSLKGAFQGAASPPRLRFISLAFRSNLAELPGLVARCQDEFFAWQNEVRLMFDKSFIDAGFKAAEMIDDEQWQRLQQTLSNHPPERVLTLSSPKPGDHVLTACPPVAPRPLGVRIEWDGRMTVNGPGIFDSLGKIYLEANINEVRDPLKLLLSL